MFASIFKPLAIGVFLCASSASAIDNWDINYISLSTDFSLGGGTNEATLDYELGKGRSSYQVALFNKGCASAIAGTTVGLTTSTAEQVPTSTDHDDLEILLDFDKQTMATSGSSIWNDTDEKLELCVRVQLLSGTDVIKEDLRDIDIAFTFNVDFTTPDAANLQAESIGTGSSTAAVDSYVQACTCDDATSFTCNTDSLSPDSLLNICVSSASNDMQIDYLDSIKVTQGVEEFVIISTGGTLEDGTISSTELVPTKNGAHVASIIPSKFFSYSGTSTAAVTGVVYLKLVGTTRRLAVEISGYPKVQSTSYVRALKSDDEDEVIFNRADALSTKKTSLPDNQVDQQVADQFSFDLQLDRKTLEVAEEHINGATMTNGFLAFAATIGAFGIML